MYLPILDDQDKRVLQVIRSRGVVAGWQVMSEAAVTADQLAKSAGTLLKSSLISASGNYSSIKEIGTAYFNLQPSNAQLVELVLNAP
jgi:hypothetical protein